MRDRDWGGWSGENIKLGPKRLGLAVTVMRTGCEIRDIDKENDLKITSYLPHNAISCLLISSTRTLALHQML